jgi:predicted hydrocarbon binding protein
VVDIKNFWVKGSPMLADVAFIRNRYGEGGLEQVMAEMSPEFAEEYRNKLLASSWYTMEFRLAILYAIDKLYAKGNMEYFLELGRNQSEHNLNNYYRSLMKLVGPTRIAKVGAMFWRLIYKTSWIEVKMKINSIEVEVHEYPVTERFNCHVIRGYIHRAIEYGVASDVHVRSDEISCINCGDDNCIFTFSWS